MNLLLSIHYKGPLCLSLGLGIEPGTLWSSTELYSQALFCTSFSPAGLGAPGSHQRADHAPLILKRVFLSFCLLPEIYPSSPVPGRIVVKQQLTFLQMKRDGFYYTFGSVLSQLIQWSCEICIAYLRLCRSKSYAWRPTIPGSHRAGLSLCTQSTGGGRWQQALIDSLD